MVMDFLNSPDRRRILFTLNSIGVLLPMYDFSEGFKVKASYILKLEPVEVTMDNFDSIFLCGEVSSNAIEDLKAIIENVSKNYLQCKQYIIMFDQLILNRFC